MFMPNIGQMACQKRAANSNRLKTNKVNKLPPCSEVWKSVEKCGMCGTEVWNNSTPLVGKAVKLQFVVKRLAVDTQQLGGTALVVSHLPQGFHDLLFFRLLVA